MGQAGRARALPLASSLAHSLTRPTASALPRHFHLVGLSTTQPGGKGGRRTAIAMLLRLPGSLISLSDNHAIMASRRCDCAVADWSVCLIVRGDLAPREDASICISPGCEIRANKCLSPPPTSLLLTLTLNLRTMDLIGDRSGRIAGSHENQSASRARARSRSLTPKWKFFRVRAAFSPRTTSDFLLPPKSLRLAVKLSRCDTPNFSSRFRLHNSATICILILKRA